MSTDKKQKLASLTGIRGVAAIWVVLFHYRTTAVVDVTVDPGALSMKGGWGVDIFFVLSGLVLALNYAVPFGESPYCWTLFRAFIKKRLFRIYPLHLVTFVAMVFLWIGASQAHLNFHSAAENTAWTAITNIFLIHAWGVSQQLSWNQPSWSISAEWFAYVFLFPLCSWSLRGWSALQLAFFALLLWLIFLFVLFLRYDGVIEHITTQGVLRIIPEFTAGIAIYRYVVDRPQQKSGDLMSAIGAAAIVAIAFSPRICVFLLLPSIMILMIGLCRGGALTTALFGNRAVAFCGEISYSIYMTHLFVQIAFNQILRRKHVAETFWHGVGILCIEIAAAVFVGYVAYRLIEVPARRALMRGSSNLSLGKAEPHTA